VANNCLIVGCGRSGTSCLAGSIAAYGYNIGGTGHAGNHSNPKGYFETKEVNGINDTMLFADKRSVFTQGGRHGWLTRFPIGMCPRPLPDTESRIRAVVESEPFCLKDPRFSYTLPIWQTYLPHVTYICVFRHPGAVVNSMLKNCKTAPYLSNIQIDRQICYDIWRNMYAHLLCHATPEWIFLHYSQVLDGTGLDVVESLLSIKSDRNFPTATLCRSEQADDVPMDIWQTYVSMCLRAGYQEGEE
jgi:hypothetical protein